MSISMTASDVVRRGRTWAAHSPSDLKKCDVNLPFDLEQQIRHGIQPRPLSQGATPYLEFIFGGDLLLFYLLQRVRT